MSLIRPTPAFVPPVVAIPAANNIVPFLPGAVGIAAGSTATIFGAPAVAVVGASIAGAVLGGVIAGQVWGPRNNPRKLGATTGVVLPENFDSLDGLTVVTPSSGTATYRVAFQGYPGNWLMPQPAGLGFIFFWQPAGNGLFYFAAQGIKQDNTLTEPPQAYPRSTVTGTAFAVPRDTPFVITKYTDAQPDGVPVDGVPAATPVPPPPILPEPEVDVQPSPERPRVLPPFVTPTIPGSRPTSPAPSGVPTPTTPRTSPPPATLPDRPLTPFPGWPVQPRVPGTATTPEGTVTPTPKPPVVKTPTNVHVVDGIPIPGNGPRPTPEGTAQELGRIERKLAQLLDTKSDAPGQPRDRLGWLHDNIGNIVDFFLSINGGGEYRISSPCVLDENGDRIERVVQYDGNLQSLGVISNKIDALAELLQEHKDLKQPICRETPATGGQAVTVNFVQID